MNKRENSDALALSGLDRSRQPALAPIPPMATGQFPPSLTEQTHPGVPQPYLCATAPTATHLEWQPRRIQQQPHPATPPSHPRRVLTKRSHQPGARPAATTSFPTQPAARFPFSVREQSHWGPRQNTSGSTAPSPTGPALPLRRLRSEPRSASPRLENSSAMAEQTHCSATHPAPSTSSTVGSAAHFPSSLRDQTHFWKRSYISDRTPRPGALATG